MKILPEKFKSVKKKYGRNNEANFNGDYVIPSFSRSFRRKIKRVATK